MRKRGTNPFWIWSPLAHVPSLTFRVSCSGLGEAGNCFFGLMKCDDDFGE